MGAPSRGEIWLVELSPVGGHEPAGRRPALVISVDEFNHGPAGLVHVIPLTTKEKGIPLHVEVLPPEGGLTRRSFLKCEDLRSVAKERLAEAWGSVGPETLAEVEDRLRILLGLQLLARQGQAPRACRTSDVG